MSKSIEDKAADYAHQWFKGEQNDHEDFYTCGQHFIPGYKADREDVVRVIEGLKLIEIHPVGVMFTVGWNTSIDDILIHLNLNS